MNLAGMIDHTILKADTTAEQVKQICAEAREYKFASVCVNTCYASLVAEELKGTEVKTCCVVGFPLGAMDKEAKAFETKRAIELGADEVDMVINVGYLKSGMDAEVKEDIKAVVDAAAGKAIVKVIIEACLLTDEEKVKVCKMSKEVGADFVKTSTGFSTGGATPADVRLMRETVGKDMGVKASGAVRSKADAEAVVEAGASRIGASASIAIVEGTKSNSDY